MILIELTRSLILILALLLSGCTGILYTRAMDKGQLLTEEDISAYERAGMNVYGCVYISGPPPAGSAMWIVVPKSVFIGINYVDGCRVK